MFHFMGMISVSVFCVFPFENHFLFDDSIEHPSELLLSLLFNHVLNGLALEHEVVDILNWGSS